LMTDRIEQATPDLPPRLRWFAPWTWRRRWSITAAILACCGIIYPASYPIAIQAAVALYGYVPSGLVNWYAPLLRLDSQSPAGYAFHEYCRLCGVPVFLDPASILRQPTSF